MVRWLRVRWRWLRWRWKFSSAADRAWDVVTVAELAGLIGLWLLAEGR